MEANQLWSTLDRLKTIKSSEVCQLLDHYALLTVYCIYFLAEDQQIRKILSNYALKWRWLRPFTNGAALKEQGIQPGPQFRVILDQLRFAWVDEEISSRSQEEKFLSRLLKSFSSEEKTA